MNEDIRTRIALSLVPKIGAHKARLLLERVDRPADVFRLSERDMLQIPGFGRVVVNHMKSFGGWKSVDAIIRRTEALGARVIIPEEQAYPARLREIDDPPIVLWVKGNVDLLNHAGIAVVGTRSPSPYGKDITRQFTRSLVQQGIVIVSGLAYGIDTVAHRETLMAGGRTIAVLGSGIDRIYPTANTPLFDRMVQEGSTVISEFPPGTKPDYCNFPTRNRVVSGITLGTLVIETGTEGGSMITARLALEQNREVFVVPHNLTNTRAGGCHKLIRESSGKLVEHVDDILSEFKWVDFDREGVREQPKQPVPDELEGKRKQLWLTLDQKGELSADELVQLLGTPLTQLNGHLLEMELGGFIRQRPGRRYALVGT
ncbi:MAG: DNA-processing protein DprA [Bacteroidetes bacterium]|nr:DNA-processing protein DprA [Bacteroidota bacterium]